MQLIKKLNTSGLIWLWVVVVVVFLDRLSKYWAVHQLTFFEPVRVLPVLDFTLAYNSGAAFSFLHNASGWQNIFFTGLAVIVSIIVLAWLASLPARARWVSIALCLILSGAIGNAWDRLLYGFVVDFLAFHYENWHFAIFNIADSAISVGAFMMFCEWCRK